MPIGTNLGAGFVRRACVGWQVGLCLSGEKTWMGSQSDQPANGASSVRRTGKGQRMERCGGVGERCMIRLRGGDGDGDASWRCLGGLGLRLRKGGGEPTERVQFSRLGLMGRPRANPLYLVRGELERRRGRP